MHYIKNPFRERSRQSLAPVVIFFLLAAAGYLHSTKGIDLTDEGMYISSPFRYALGDTPFRDEVMNLARPFDILVMPIYRLLPDISLLEIRLLGVSLQIAGLLAAFALFSRYASPLIVSLACAAAFFWSDPYNIISPSYNTMARDFSILSLILWLNAIATEQRYLAATYSALAGCLLGLACLSYYSQGVLIVVPIAFILYCVCSSYSKDHWPYIRLSLMFVAAFGLFLCAAIYLAAQVGILDGYGFWLNEMTNTNDVKILGLSHKLKIVFMEFLGTLPRGLLLMAVAIIGLTIVSLNPLRKRPIVAVALTAILFPATVYILIRSPLTLFLGFAIPLAILLACLPQYDRSGPLHREWFIVRSVAMLWGLLSVLVFSVSSGGALKNGLLGVAIVSIVAFISVHRLLLSRYPLRFADRLGGSAVASFAVMVISAFIIAGLYHLYDYRYRESAISSLTARFDHPKLKGIYSTPQKVHALERLLHDLEQKLEPSGYFLAYNSVPMLYFLTHTRPGLAVTWARDDWPLSTRRHLVDKMIAEGKLPEYSVRMLALPEGDWTTEMPYDEQSPLDNFIQSNYCLEKIIYPFEIWHRGPGQKFRIFNDYRVLYHADFSDWKRKRAVSEQDLTDQARPLMRLGDRGTFVFSGIPGGGIKIASVARNEENECKIQFGYSLGSNGFEIDLAPGQTAVLVVEARLKGTPESAASLFIQDQSTNWERHNASIYKHSWDQYAVSKRIRDGSRSIQFGIEWKPKNEVDELEIRNLRILLEKEVSP